MVPQPWTKNSAFSTQGAVPSLTEAKGNPAALRGALTGCSEKILLSFSVPPHLLKHTCKGVGYSLFSLISNANQRGKKMWRLLNYSIKLVGFPSQYSFFSDFLYFRGLYLPKLPSHWNRLFLRGKCWGGETDTKCKRNNQRSSTACGSWGLQALAEQTQAHNPHRKRVSAVPEEFHLKAKRKQGLVNAIVTEIAATYTQLFLLYHWNPLHLIESLAALPSSGLAIKRGHWNALFYQLQGKHEEWDF